MKGNSNDHRAVQGRFQGGGVTSTDKVVTKPNDVDLSY